MIEGRIIKGIGGFYYIETEKGLYECRARGIFRKNKITPLVGDFVKISVVDEDNKKGVVEEIQERKTELVRPPIANVNKALIVFAVKNPTPHLSLLDRFIVLAERENLEIVIILTKIDLDDDNTFEKIKNIYEPCGYKVIGVSNLENKNIDKVKEELKDKLEYLAEFLGGEISVSGDYPAWEYRAESDIREGISVVYEELFHEEPVFEAIHAGLECGILSGKIADLDCVSFGPNNFDIHTPKERLSISSTEKVWKLIVEFLKRSK